MKQKNCIWAVAATMLLAAASFTSCYKQDNVIYPEPITDPDYSFDEGSIIQNGMCENLTDVKYYWVNIGQDGGEYTGPATIKWDEETRDNHCVIVNARSESEARAAGNFGAQTWADPTKYADHDTQFFITFGEENALKEKDQIRITMDIKAEADFTAATGTHTAPGAYLSNGIGNVPFTTDWTSYDSGFVTISKQQAGTYSIAFNLANTNKDEANRFFFDNIRVEVIRFIPDPEPVQIEGMKVVFWNWGKADDTKLSTKYFKNYGSTTVEDGVIVVKSLEPGKKYTEYYNESGKDTPIDAVLANDHDTQLLFSLPEKYPAGTKMKISMKVKADIACNIGAQYHKAIPAPGTIEKAGSDYEGTYLHWTIFGWGQDIPVTTEWTTFEKDFTVPSEDAINNNGGIQSICLNLNLYKDAANTYYFDDVTIYAEKGEEPVFAKDWTTETSYPYYWMGDQNNQPYFAGGTATVQVENGALVITNTTVKSNNWDVQPFIMDWFNLTGGKNYKVRLTMAASADGAADLEMGTWTGSMKKELQFTASENFKQYDIEFENSTVNSSSNDVHILFQPGKYVGTVKIKKVELFEN